MKRLAKQHGRFTILRASQHQFASCSRVMFVVRDGTTLESNRHLKCSSPCGLWCLCPTQESNQEEFRKPFPDSDKEFELDFKLKSPVFTKKRVWRHLILAQTAGSRTNAETQICTCSRCHGADFGSTVFFRFGAPSALHIIGPKILCKLYAVAVIMHMRRTGRFCE